MKQWLLAMVLLFSALEYALSDEKCPDDFDVCPSKETITSPGESVILHCITKKVVKSCEWRTPFEREGIIISESDPDYRKYNPSDNDKSCNVEIIRVKDEDYGNWTCTPVVEGDRKRIHSTPGFLSFATTPVPPYIVANEQINPRLVNVTEGHSATVTCKVDGSRPAPQIQWYLGFPDNGTILKNLTDHSVAKSTLIDDEDSHMLLKTMSALVVTEDGDMNGHYIWCNMTHISLQPGDGYMASTKLNISYSPKFSDITSRFEFEVNTKGSFKLRFRANPGPREDQDVKLLIGSVAVSSGRSNDDKTITIGKVKSVKGHLDTYESEITFKEITVEQTKTTYMLSVMNHVGKASLHKFIVVVHPSDKKDNNIGLIIGIVVLSTVFIFCIAIFVYAYKKSKFCFAPSEHVSVPTEPVPKPKKRNKDMRNMSMIKRSSHEEQGHEVA